MLVLLVIRTVAVADPAEEAEAHFKKGSALYDLGRFEESIVELEAAYTTEPAPKYLFAIAQGHRFAKHYDKAISLYRRYLDVKPDDPRRPDIEGVIAELEKAKAAQLAADQAARDKALADKIAADQAAAAKIAAEIAAQKRTEENKHIRVGLDVGFSIVHLQGSEDDPRPPAIGGRIGVAYIKRIGSFAFDFGGSWHITTIPYATSNEKTATVVFTQLHATAAATHKIAGPIWGRLGVGVGFAAFSNLKNGNPIRAPEPPPALPTNNGGPDVRTYCMRVDTAVGYRYDATIDFVLGLLSASYSPSSGRDVEAKPKSATTLEGITLGLFLKI